MAELVVNLHGQQDALTSPILDACAMDTLGLPMQPQNDPAAFFVGDIDIAEPHRPAMRECQSSSDLLAQLEAAPDALLGSNSHTAGDFLGTSAPAAIPNWGPFPTIPEHAELTLPTSNPLNALKRGYASTLPLQHSPVSSADPAFFDCSAGTSPAGSSASSGAADGGGDMGAFGGRGRRFSSAATVPRVASMPNLHLALQAQATNTDNAQPMIQESGAGLRRRNGGASSGQRNNRTPRSRSANDLTDLTGYVIPHAEFLTPPHLRKGKGGRQPAADPRLDPRIDPRKAKRILANRLSAAKSKLKQKSATQGLRQRVEMLRLQREGLATEVAMLEHACKEQETEGQWLLTRIREVEEQGGVVPENAAGMLVAS
jgi:hypothetical protein